MSLQMGAQHARGPWNPNEHKGAEAWLAQREEFTRAGHGIPDRAAARAAANRERDRSERFQQGGGPPHGGHDHYIDDTVYYLQWRDEELRRLDEEYQVWRSERQQDFERELEAWRRDRGRRAGAGNPGEAVGGASY